MEDAVKKPLEELRRITAGATDEIEAARVLSERDRDYYDGHQKTKLEEEEAKRRKLPLIINNRIQRKIDAMVGIEQNGRTDPRAFARGPEDEKAADLATKALVFVDDQTRFDTHRSASFENLLVEGYGGVEIGVEERRGRFEVTVKRLRWEEIFYDPASREKDFSDAAFLGVMRWMTIDQAVSLYGGSYQGDDLEGMLDGMLGNISQSYDDRPDGEKFAWADQKQKRVRIVQMYYRQGGDWHLCIFTGGGEIYHDKSPYVDEDGDTACPMILMTAYVDRKNTRYGVVRSLISMQDEINARRSRALQMMFNRQTQSLKGAVDPVILKRELAKPDGHVEVDPDLSEAASLAGMPAFSVIQNGDQLAAQFLLLQESKEEIDKLGPNASLLGQLTGEQSGRAIMAQQQAGMAELAPIYDSLRDWTLRCYRAMWARIKQFWTDERWIRITEDLESPSFIGVNMMTGMDPVTFQPVIENHVAEMDVDITINDAPDFVTLRQEQFEQIKEMAAAGIPIPPEMIVEVSSLRDKARIIELIKDQQAQQAQQQAAMMQAQQQAQMADQQIKQVDTQSHADLRQAQAEKAQAEAVKTQMETRIAAVTPIMPRTPL